MITMIASKFKQAGRPHIFFKTPCFQAMVRQLVDACDQARGVCECQQNLADLVKPWEKTFEQTPSLFFLARWQTGSVQTPTHRDTHSGNTVIAQFHDTFDILDMLNVYCFL